MIFAYSDASALLKRYYVEIGSAEMDHLFRRVSLNRMFVLAVGYTEVASVLKRRRNASRLPLPVYQLALRRLQAEIGPASPVTLVAVDGDLADAAIDLVDRHSINSTDAALLRSALDLAASLRTVGDDVLVVASDVRLLRAAKAEGLATYNPESEPTTTLDALLGP
ncbi:MAG TPA: type II toxin-antitoxin system VapC family toxin [Gemmataceae bacterium]|jgi:predicted nucleic acid-binding protein